MPSAHGSKKAKSWNGGIPNVFLHIYASWLEQAELLEFPMCLLVCKHPAIDQGVSWGPINVTHLGIPTILVPMQAV